MKIRYIVTDILNDDYLLEGLDIEEQVFLPKDQIKFSLDYKDVLVYDQDTKTYELQK